MTIFLCNVTILRPLPDNSNRKPIPPPSFNKALKMHLQKDQPPGFGYWIETGGATTLWEAYDMDSHNQCVTGRVSKDCGIYRYILL